MCLELGTKLLSGLFSCTCISPISLFIFFVDVSLFFCWTPLNSWCALLFHSLSSWYIFFHLSIFFVLTRGNNFPKTHTFQVEWIPLKKKKKLGNPLYAHLLSESYEKYLSLLATLFWNWMMMPHGTRKLSKWVWGLSLELGLVPS